MREAAAVPRDVVRIVYRDPERVCEQMTLFASQRLADRSREWAETARTAAPQADVRQIADRLGSQSARIARIEGAVAGTPFYIALVPGYMNYLWQEIRMTLRLAALYGRDPGALRTLAEVLWLRGVYETVEAATEGLLTVQAGDLPPQPAHRRSPRVWIRSVRRLLIFGGFLSPPRSRPHHGLLSWLRDGVGLLAGAVVWVVTWIFPATLMIAMAWGCHTHARRLFRTAVGYYAGEPTAPKSGRDRLLELRSHSGRDLLHGLALSVSILTPIGFLVLATRVREHLGLDAISGLGVLVAVSLVLAAAVYGSRR